MVLTVEERVRQLNELLDGSGAEQCTPAQKATVDVGTPLRINYVAGIPDIALTIRGSGFRYQRCGGGRRVIRRRKGRD